MNTRIQSYVHQFNEIFAGSPWIDETFSGKLDGLTEEQVFTQAPGNNHSVAEIVSHIVVWRNEITRRLANNVSDTLLTDESPENWLPLHELKRTGWQELYHLLHRSQKELIALLEDKDDAFWMKTWHLLNRRGSILLPGCCNTTSIILVR
jgi:uncharacterized damage-inducible protein DinB